MASNLYQSVLADPLIKKASVSAGRAIEKELTSKVFPSMPNIADRFLGVSFPAQIGFARYDIETASHRDLVGRAFGVERTHNSSHRGVVTILLFETPIISVCEGWFVPKELEVWYRNELIGKVIQAQNEGRFQLSSRKGDAEIVLRDDYILVQHGSETHQFNLQLNLNSLPGLRQSDANLSGTLIYNPEISACDPVVVMAFILSMRMIYRRADFNNT